MDTKYKLIQKLKENYFNDFVVIVERFGDYKYFIFSDYKKARAKYKQLVNKLELPCTIQIHLLN